MEKKLARPIDVMTLEKEIGRRSNDLQTQPTVDVVIPCYNYGRFLNSCVESVVTQQGVSARAIIIDDASTDDSSAVGQELSNRHNNVEFYGHSKNRGHIATYNEGLLAYSTADYVVLLSADDMLAPGSLGRAVRIMESDESIGIVYGRTIHFQNESELPRSVEATTIFDRFTGTEWIDKRLRAGYNVITSPEVVVRGSIQRKIGGYRPELPHSGDLEMWLRVAAVSNVAYVRGIQAFYRVHSSSMQRTTYKSSFVDLVHRKAAFDWFFEHHPNYPHNQQRHKTVSLTLAREALWDACRAYDHNCTESARVDELVQFALDSSSESQSSSEYSALKRRQILGAPFCNRTQMFIVPASIRWMSRKLKKKRMLQYGI